MLGGAGSGATSPGQTSLTRVKSPLPPDWSLVTVMRTCAVETVLLNGTWRCTSALPVIDATGCHVVPSQASTVKSCGTPSTLDSRVMPGRLTLLGAVMVRTSWYTPIVSSFQNVSLF